MQVKDSEPESDQWVAPGPGRWMCESSHFPVPTSATLRQLWAQLTAGGMRDACARYGLPIDGFVFQTLRGWTFSTIVATPPDELPSRDEAAASALRTRPWIDDVTAWNAEKSTRIARNRALQEIDVATLEDVSLALHVRAVYAHLVDGSLRHMELHLADMIPTGRLLVATRAGGIDDAHVLQLLAGVSPASRVDEDLLAHVDGDAAALDRYLETHRWHTISRWDIDAPTLGEHPEVVAATLRALARNRRAPATTDHDSLRALPVDPLLVDDALATFGLRDDNVAVLGSWPMGLLRRAMLEAGNRLLERGLLSIADLALEATPHELAAMLEGFPPVTAGELAERRLERQAAELLSPPAFVGDDDPMLLDGAGPSSLELLAGLDVYGQLMEAPISPSMTGIGIGQRSLVGRAVVAHSPEDAAAHIEDGDVLVTYATSPAFDHLLAVVGAVVTVAGGLLSHTAVYARETGLTAVLGVGDALREIRTGDVVEVDPVRGRVTVVSR